MIRKIVYALLILCLALFIAFWVIKLMGDPKPSSGTEEYLKLHGYVEGQVNEIRVGGVLLRFPAGVKYSPHTSGKIIKGQADSVTAGIFYPAENEISSPEHGVMIELRANGVEDPNIWDKREDKKEKISIVKRDDLGLIEYHLKPYDGAWGYITYTSKNEIDKTPRGSLIRYECAGIPQGEITNCWSYFVGNKNVLVKYYISGKNLKNWKIIHKEVVDFINSIIVEE